ncbi:MAG: ATP--guanido phosphotransferase [Elusimicrobia bacterium]|nr:ATP--guanido phosphotransferase [Elusimicrobiota bacterium]
MSFQLQNLLKLKMNWATASGPTHETVLSSRVRLARNLARLPFPSHGSPRHAAAALEDAFAAGRRSRPLAKAAYLRLDELEPTEHLFLAERRLISPALLQNPKQRGVIVGEREILSVMVNEEDHLRLQAVDSGLCLPSLWQRLSALDAEFGRSLEFAYDRRWGYLTSCPTNAGTGMRVSALLHLPGLAIAGMINPILKGLQKIGMTARGMYGEGTKVLGDFYQVSNATTLGRSEEDFVQRVSGAVLGVVEREREAQRALSEGARRIEIEDLVHRAIGILSHARSISFEEGMQHLSYVRLALSLRWKMPIGWEALNELLVLAQPAHLQMRAGRAVASAERRVLRADMIRAAF